MLALALVLIVIGIIGLFFFTYAGAVVGAIGIILLIAFLVGFGRSTATEHTPRPRA
jgi:membrane-bound ClpP family serine protease